MLPLSHRGSFANKMFDFHDGLKSEQTAGVESCVWKIEGLDRREDCKEMATGAQRDGRDQVGSIMSVRGENDQKFHGRLTIAGSVEGFICFAVGRTDFRQPPVDFSAKKINHTRSRRDGVARLELPIVTRSLSEFLRRPVLHKN